MINFIFFCAFFPSFISNTSILSITFRANLNAQNAGNGISGLQNFTNFLGEYGLQPFLSLSNISHRKLPCPPTGKSLKKALTSIAKKNYKMSVYILNLYF